MNVLAVFAHPDDETMLFGGALALLAAQGAAVYGLSATRGEGGEAGEPPVCERHELGAVRQEELACAVQALGMAGLTYLDYVDPTVGPGDELYPFQAEWDILVQQIAAHIRKVAAQAVITHGSNGEYGHPAHQLVHRATRAAVESLQDAQLLLYSAQANYPDHPKPHLINKDDPAHFLLDASPVLERKVAAAMCHRTQHALFVRRASQRAGRPLSVPEVIAAWESLHRHLPPATSVPLHDPLVDLLRSSGSVHEPDPAWQLDKNS
ncbi:MAG: hypothetical protein GYA17_14520 [Chloroflexi bacterium]|nr:hypothetical protein [Chloroflexota bacterium]